MIRQRAAPLPALELPRRLPVAAAAFALLAGGLVLAHPALAADGGLVVVTETTYDVLPDQARVHVTVDAVATSHEPVPEDDAEEVVYRGVSFAIQPAISNLAASADGEPLEATVTASTDSYTVVDVAFAEDVQPQHSYAYTVSFDLVDPGGEPGRDMRIGSSLVAFSAWAFGSENEPGGSVRILLPAGFLPEVQGTEMVRTDAPTGEIVLSAQPQNPFAFFAYVTADRPGAFAETRVRFPIGPNDARLVIRAWEDDPEWGVRIRRLMRRGLPALAFLTGLPYPSGAPLRVEEAATSRLGEYAGLFEQATRQIRVRYDADALVGLHEAAHVWFNESLFKARWINEGWAEYYAVSAADRLGETGETYELTDDLLPARIPLDEWGAVGVESLDVEDYAYAASYELARRVAARTDLDGLRSVWQAAMAGDAAYLPIGTVGEAAPAPAGASDWQRLLDLLEERTGRRYADLWAEWVVDERQSARLEVREAARDRYRSVAHEAADWELPASIRADLETWDFPAATRQLDLASEILGDRERITVRSARLQLRQPEALQAAFEGDAGLSRAAELATDELAALAAIGSATTTIAVDPTPLEWIGLLGRRPGAALASARDAFQSGRMTDAVAQANRAEAAREASAGIGADRSILGASGLLSLDGLALVALSGRRLRRAARTGTLRAP